MCVLEYRNNIVSWHEGMVTPLPSVILHSIIDHMSTALNTHWPTSAQPLISACLRVFWSWLIGWKHHILSPAADKITLVFGSSTETDAVGGQLTALRHATVSNVWLSESQPLFGSDELIVYISKRPFCVM